MPPKKSHSNNKRKHDEKEVKIPPCPMNITDKGPHKKFLINYMEFIKSNNPQDANKIDAANLILTDCFEHDWEAFLDYRKEQDDLIKEEREKKKAEKEAKENENKEDQDENNPENADADDEKEEVTADLLTKLKKTTKKLEKNMSQLQTPKDREIFEENVLASVSAKISKVIVKTDKVVPIMDQVISVMKEVASKLSDKQLTIHLTRAKTNLKKCIAYIDSEHKPPMSPDDIVSPLSAIANISNQGSPHQSPFRNPSSNPSSNPPSNPPSNPSSNHASPMINSSGINSSGMNRKRPPSLNINSPNSAPSLEHSS